MKTLLVLSLLLLSCTNKESEPEAEFIVGEKVCIVSGESTSYATLIDFLYDGQDSVEAVVNANGDIEMVSAKDIRDSASCEGDQ